MLIEVGNHGIHVAINVGAWDCHVMEASVSHNAIPVGGTAGLAIRGLRTEATDLLVRQTTERSRDGIHSWRTRAVFEGALGGSVGIIGLPFMFGHGR